MRSRRQFSTKLKLSLINLCLGLPLQPHHSRGETGQVRTGQVCRGLRQSRRWTVWPLPRLAGGPLAGGTRLTSWSTQRLQVPPAAHLCHRNLVSKKKKKHNNKKKKKTHTAVAGGEQGEWGVSAWHFGCCGDSWQPSGCVEEAEAALAAAPLDRGVINLCNYL